MVLGVKGSLKSIFYFIFKQQVPITRQETTSLSPTQDPRATKTGTAWLTALTTLIYPGKDFSHNKILHCKSATGQKNWLLLNPSPSCRIRGLDSFWINMSFPLAWEVRNVSGRALANCYTTGSITNYPQWKYPCNTANTSASTLVNM